MILPKELIANCRKSAERMSWLAKLPAMVTELAQRWSFTAGRPFAHATCSWVAPVVCGDGTHAVLKIGMPHMEALHEIQGLRAWNGDPTVQLLKAEDELGAMLLERCIPGSMLRVEPEPKQDEVIAMLCGRLRRRARLSNGQDQFRHLSEMLAFWTVETVAQARNWPDAGLVSEGLRMLEVLAKPCSTDTLLVTDLHAGNVLRSRREPWTVIDPKPFIGDPCFEPVQHLMNCESRLHADPIGLIRRVGDLAEIDHERLRLWTFARAAAEPREHWDHRLWMEVARALAP